MGEKTMGSKMNRMVLLYMLILSMVSLPTSLPKHLLVKTATDPPAINDYVNYRPVFDYSESPKGPKKNYKKELTKITDDKKRKGLWRIHGLPQRSCGGCRTCLEGCRTCPQERCQGYHGTIEKREREQQQDREVGKGRRRLSVLVLLWRVVRILYNVSEKHHPSLSMGLSKIWDFSCKISVLV